MNYQSSAFSLLLPLILSAIPVQCSGVVLLKEISLVRSTTNQESSRSPSVKAPAQSSLDEWMWLREWVLFGFGISASALSIYLFFQNQNLKSINQQLEADRLAMEAWKILLGDEEAIYSPSENPVALEEACQKIDSALRQDSKNPRATRLKALTLAAKGEKDEAIQYARRTVSLAPKSFEAHLVSGNVFLEFQDHEKALDAYGKAAKLNPRSNLAFMNMGDLLRHKDRPEAALSMYRKAIKAKRNDFRAANNLGYLLFKQGETREAVEVFTESLRENPDNSLLRFNLGNALIVMGRTQEALTQYKKSLELDPSFLLNHTSLIPTGEDEIQISRDPKGNWQISIGANAESLKRDDVESRPYDEPGSPKAAGFWRIDSDLA